MPSSLPIELIDSMLEGDNKGLGYLRFLRLFRLLRLLRLLKVGEYIAGLEIRFDLNLTFLRIVQMLLALLFLAHILGCFWFYMAALVGIDADIVTWVSTYDDGKAALPLPQHSLSPGSANLRCSPVVSPLDGERPRPPPYDATSSPPT